MSKSLHANSAEVVSIAAHGVEENVAKAVAQYNNLEKSSACDVLANIRSESLHEFKKTGLPTTRHEDWKYTDLHRLANSNFDIVTKSSESLSSDTENKIANIIAKLSERLSKDSNAQYLVLIDGELNSGLSKYNNSDLNVFDLRNYITAQNNSFAKYLNKNANRVVNTSYEQDPMEHYINSVWMQGLVVEVRDNCKSKVDLTIINIFTNAVLDKAISNKYIISVGLNSELILQEQFVDILNNADKEFNNNNLFDIYLAKDSVFKHYALQAMQCNNHHIAIYNIDQDKGSEYHSYNINIGAKLARQNINVFQNEDHASCYLNGAFLPAGTQHMDSHLKVYHKASHGKSTQDYRGVLAGRGHGVFNGMVYVAVGTVDNNADQSNKNILLSKNAEVDTKPELQIYADDVVCSHGATIGRLDEKALFYLRSRGICEHDAKYMLILSFVNHILDKVKVESIRAWVSENITTVLELMSDKVEV